MDTGNGMKSNKLSVYLSLGEDDMRRLIGLDAREFLPEPEPLDAGGAVESRPRAEPVDESRLPF